MPTIANEALGTGKSYKRVNMMPLVPDSVKHVCKVKEMELP